MIVLKILWLNNPAIWLAENIKAKELLEALPHWCYLLSVCSRRQYRSTSGHTLQTMECQFSRFLDFYLNVNNHNELEAYLKPCQTSKMLLFAKIIDGFQLLTVCAKKKFILDVWQGSEYASVIYPKCSWWKITQFDNDNSIYLDHFGLELTWK